MNEKTVPQEPARDREELAAAARAVALQAGENPGLGIPVDPDVAEFMGAADFGELPPEALEPEEPEASDGRA